MGLNRLLRLLAGNVISYGCEANHATASKWVCRFSFEPPTLLPRSTKSWNELITPCVNVGCLLGNVRYELRVHNILVTCSSVVRNFLYR